MRRGVGGGAAVGSAPAAPPRPRTQGLRCSRAKPQQSRHTKTNKTIGQTRAEGALRQEIDDFDGFNNSEDGEESIENFDVDGDGMAENEVEQEHILHNVRVNNLDTIKFANGANQVMDNIDEEEEEDLIEAQNQERKFREVYQSARLDGKKI